LHSLKLASSGNNYSGPGWFRIDLLSKTTNSDNAVKLEDAPTKNAQWYSTSPISAFDLQMSDYWFID
jgi:hypothetical protein